MIRSILNRIQWLLEIFFWSESYHSLVFETAKVVSTGKNLLKKIHVENESGSKVYIHLFDRDAAPVANEAPLISYVVQPNSDNKIDLQYTFNTGIFIGISDTQFTWTQSAANTVLHAEFKKLSPKTAPGSSTAYSTGYTNGYL